MKVCENGIYREMTADEAVSFEEYLKAISDTPDETEKLKDRIEMLEECLIEMSMIIYA